ncbi:hypothetical protein P4V43_26480 [Brevibacillus fortis]|uniref:Uncharacterized protein n=1 Tax=Brevibacillus fortis TaxID=2126352 RepID=A0A2P7VBN0_9BACL|nr:hypothetical protein [Brevibacillus fortis]MED1785374.1 hypothetical protein [Brevibacillus fortis]PSJ96605.1 hypothetical protein C7R93_10485 [Brevibacillus fortis]
MNVIGIIQTDLNEFNVLFEQQGGQGGNGQGQGQQGQQSNDSGQNNQQNQDSDSMFLSFLDEQPSSNESSGQGNSQGGQQQNSPQELTVRIKGIPEGQKANFLQMYQILQDAQDSQTLEKDLTIVDHGDQDQGSQKQGQGHGSGKQNKTTH